MGNKAKKDKEDDRDIHFEAADPKYKNIIAEIAEKTGLKTKSAVLNRLLSIRIKKYEKFDKDPEKFFQ